jgi:hypothetical protein
MCVISKINAFCSLIIFRWGQVVYPELQHFPDWAEAIVNASSTTTTTIAPMIAEAIETTLSTLT